MFKSLIFASLLAAGSAHQNFHQFWVNDVSPGFEVGIRMPPSNSPVEDVTSNNIVCNVPGTNAPAGGVATVDVAAGDKITVQWDQSTHPGPITHMLFGPIPSAALASGVGEWAKIDELNAVDGKWANEIMSAVDMKHSFNLPANLASGEYLLRSEMLALHGASTVGGAQFYIGCAQIKVTGPGGSCGAKITLPGAYDANEAAILIPNLYNGFSPDNYTAPGGPVAVCAAGAGGSSPTTLATTTRAATSSAVVSSTVAVVPTSAVVSASSSVAAPVESSSSIAAPIPTSSSIPTSSAAALPSTTVSPSKTACKSKTIVPTLAPSSSAAPSKSACKPKSSSAIAAVPSAASASVSSVAAAPSASSTGVSTAVSFYGQCGGVNYSGSTVCAAGSTCVKSNDWYSQCVRS